MGVLERFRYCILYRVDVVTFQQKPRQHCQRKLRSAIVVVNMTHKNYYGFWFSGVKILVAMFLSSFP